MYDVQHRNDTKSAKKRREFFFLNDKELSILFHEKGKKRKDKHMYIWNSRDFMQKASENEWTD